MHTDLYDYGFTPETIIGECDGLMPGRVIERRRELFKVICENGEAGAELKGSLYNTLADEEGFPAVGDFVLIQYNDSGNSLIARVLPRRSKFSRANFGGHSEGYAKYIKEQVVAVNFDYVFILSSLNQDFNPARLGRYLSASWQSGGFPVVVLTKADLCADSGAQAAEARMIAGNAAPVICVSSKTGNGLEELEPFMESGKTIVFLGSSGVGKSSLLNRLAGQNLMEVKAIRDDDDKGRHTTTHRQLFRLPSGALVIDTPGMRELGLWDAREGISLSFADLEDIAAQCRFSDCGHLNEPGCAVRAALEDGRITAKQWKQYQAQQREADFMENHSDYLKKKRESHKSIALYTRAMQKNGLR